MNLNRGQAVTNRNASSVKAQLADGRRCVRRTFLKLRHGLQCAAATLGTALHRSTALYDQSVLDGRGLTIDETAGAAVDAIHKPQAASTIWKTIFRFDRRRGRG